MEDKIYSYLKFLNIQVSKRYLKKLILSHPHYPSLLSITDALQGLGISHQVARVSKQNINDVALPYLMTTKGRNDWLQLLKSKDELAAIESDMDKDRVILKVEPGAAISNKDNDEYRSKEVFSNLIFGAFILSANILIVLSLVYFFSWFYMAILVTASIGVITGYLLVTKELGLILNPIEALCHAGENTNCDSILNSEGAKILGDIKLSDAVIVYFTFQLATGILLIPFTGEIAPFLWILSVFSVLTIPVIAYSLFYQYFKERFWCPLCLAVDIILIIQAGFFAWMYAKKIIYLRSESPLISAFSVFLFGMISFSVVLLKNKLQEVKESEEEQLETKRVKYSIPVFTHLLTREDKVNTQFFNQELLIGEPDAPVNLVMAGSLSCGPCKAGFQKAVNLLAVYPKKISLAVRFLNSADNRKYILKYWLHNICGKDEESRLTKHLLQDWYRLMNLKKFKKEYPLGDKQNVTDQTVLEKIEEQQDEWFDHAEIEGTPTFFINGYKKPENYTLKDMVIIAPGLVAHLRQTGEVVKLSR